MIVIKVNKMKFKKKIFFVSLLLILFICLSAVSAQDTDMNSTINNNDYLSSSQPVIIASSNNDVLSQSGDVDLLSVDSASSISFSKFNSEIKSAGSSLKLTSDVTFSSGDSAGGIVISKSMTIDGNGHTIDGKSKTRIFKVASGKTLTLKNVNIVNAASSDSGGAILNSGTIKLTNCNFTNCKVTGSKSCGGAITGAGGGTITKCNFNKCTAAYMGGAIQGKKLKIYDSNFVSNSARTGGALGGTVYIYNSHFKNCIATNGDGGAGCGDFPMVKSSTFENCKAKKGFGGALRGTTKAYSSKFTNCVAKEGGAIRGKGITSKCTFTSCVATKSMGGAIFTEKTTIDKCTFVKCSASKSNGGAVYIGNNAKVTNCKFTRCTASKGSGGAVYGVGAISKCTFTKNHAKLGGAVSCYYITVKSSTFTSNSAGKGGAAYSIKSMTSCKVISNTATYGGALYSVKKVTSTKFSGNKSKHGPVRVNA